MAKEEIVIVSAARTPFDKFGGLTKKMTTVELASIVFEEIMKRAQVKPEEIEEVYLGINWPTSNRSIARQAALKSGMPPQVNATTVDRACCSSMVAIAMAYRAIALGEIEIAIGGGSENMSNVPYFVEDLRWGKRIGDVVLKDIMVVSCPYTGRTRAVQAGEGAVKYNISREEQDKWALRSQQLYQKALEAGKFNEEIIPIRVEVEKNKFELLERDQSPRPDTTLEKLSKLPTVYNSPTVTPGNAPGMNSGAAAVVLMNKKKALEKGLEPLATIISHAQVSDHPDGIVYTPAYAALKALKKAGMTIEQMDVIEINEAFAAMPLVSTKILGGDDEKKIEAIRAKTNINGGAIAIGHPTGATGARILMTACYELKRRGGGYGLVTICGGIGEGECFIIKVES